MQGIETAYPVNELNLKRYIFLNMQLPSTFGTVTHF